MREVLETNDPVRQKSLGRNVKTCNMNIWKEKVPEIIFPISLENFKQNVGPQKFLLDTGSKHLSEATTERYKGVGTKLADGRPFSYCTYCLLNAKSMYPY